MSLMKSSAYLGISVLVTGCGTYEPAMPGKHRAPGEPVAETTCVYEAPTATRFTALRCRTTADMKQNAELARDAADAIRTPPPDVR